MITDTLYRLWLPSCWEGRRLGSCRRRFGLWRAPLEAAPKASRPRGNASDADDARRPQLRRSRPRGQSRAPCADLSRRLFLA
ncbi:hypothetical protein HMPREF0972_02227 [Actinomyces sp. oral taxon 848 str. F0332]|nr:hypothetical protein HMPREF0972_02227 [Actinomyces sp. oral taxon 848 str. F0332]